MRLQRLRAEFKRGHVGVRSMRRLQREAQRAATRLVLALTKPRVGEVCIATLDPAEENASATAALLGDDRKVSRILYFSPDPRQSRSAVEAASRRLRQKPLANIEYLPLRYWRLLRAYSRSSQTYSTHVLLPGVDPSGRRAHVHLTHGSGPKPDSTFQGPTNILAAIVDAWIPAQLQEYGLTSTTPILPIMPRLEVMHHASRDKSVISRLGLPDQCKLVVWAPTYRAIRRPGNETRVSGLPFSEDASNETRSLLLEFQKVIEECGGQLVTKIHPFDADNYHGLGSLALTNSDLRTLGVTSYELFGAADLLITDYSSVFTERAALGLPYLLFCPDLDEFATSYRGFRIPTLQTVAGSMLVSSADSLRRGLTSYQESYGASARSTAERLGIRRFEETLKKPESADNRYDLLYRRVENAYLGRQR